MKISIIIPILNEAAQLPICMTHWRDLERDGAEVLVVDGGSWDESPTIVREAQFALFESSPGRSRQMNRGASMAQGDVLLFLHADTTLPEGALSKVRLALGDETRTWGRFDVKIVGKGGMLPIIAAFINIRSRLSGIATGDQAVFVRRKTFEHIKGFPDQPLMEDIELSKKLLKTSSPLCLSSRVLTSGRRWETKGTWTTIFLMWRLRWSYWRGRSAEDLAKDYR